MDIPVSRIVLCGGLFLLTVLSGFWLSRSGKPYKTGIFNIHKLIALATVILAGLTSFGLLRAEGPADLLGLVMVGAGALLFAALFATGALMSIKQGGPLLYLRIHQIVPALAFLATGAGFYLLTMS